LVLLAVAETLWGGVGSHERAVFDEEAGQDGREKLRELQSGEERGQPLYNFVCPGVEAVTGRKLILV
jgi:hypothetical protein